jgi:hypothetical protein
MEKRIDRQAEGAQERPKRTPLGSRNVLAVPNRPGYHRVWVSDSSSIRPSISAYEESGYTFVNDPLKVGDKYINSGNPIVSAVSRPGGKGVTLYLMEVLDEYYNEDLRLHEEKIRKKEKDMFDPRSIEGGYGKIQKKDNRSESSGEF